MIPCIFFCNRQHHCSHATAVISCLHGNTLPPCGAKAFRIHSVPLLSSPTSFHQYLNHTIPLQFKFCVFAIMAPINYYWHRGLVANITFFIPRHFSRKNCCHNCPSITFNMHDILIDRHSVQSLSIILWYFSAAATMILIMAAIIFFTNSSLSVERHSNYWHTWQMPSSPLTSNGEA